jgi:hypothetical protein
MHKMRGFVSLNIDANMEIKRQETGPLLSPLPESPLAAAAWTDVPIMFLLGTTCWPASEAIGLFRFFAVAHFEQTPSRCHFIVHCNITKGGAQVRLRGKFK